MLERKPCKDPVAFLYSFPLVSVKESGEVKAIPRRTGQLAIRESRASPSTRRHVQSTQSTGRRRDLNVNEQSRKPHIHKATECTRQNYLRPII